MLMYQPGLPVSTAFQVGDITFAAATVASCKNKTPKMASCKINPPQNFSALRALFTFPEERVQPERCCPKGGHCFPAKFSDGVLLESQLALQPWLQPLFHVRAVPILGVFSLLCTKMNVGVRSCEE